MVSLSQSLCTAFWCNRRRSRGTQMWGLWACCYGDAASCFMVHLVFSFGKWKAVHAKTTMRIYLINTQAGHILLSVPPLVCMLCFNATGSSSHSPHYSWKWSVVIQCYGAVAFLDSVLYVVVFSVCVCVCVRFLARGQREPYWFLFYS